MHYLVLVVYIYHHIHQNISADPKAACFFNVPFSILSVAL